MKAAVFNGKELLIKEVEKAIEGLKSKKIEIKKLISRQIKSDNIKEAFASYKLDHDYIKTITQIYLYILILFFLFFHSDSLLINYNYIENYFVIQNRLIFILLNIRINSYSKTIK